MKTLNRILVAAALVVPALASTNALALNMSHEYYSRNRSPYGSNVYLSQQAMYARTTTTLGATQAKPGAGVPTSADYRGYALQTSVGLEHFRFLQTGLFYSNTNVTGSGHRDRTLNGHDFGAEAKIVLTSPVVNVGLGGGAYLTKKDYALGLQNGSLSGSGYRAGLEFTYFAASNVSLQLSGVQIVETLADKSQTAAYSKLSAKGLRIGGGLAIWL